MVEPVTIQLTRYAPVVTAKKIRTRETIWEKWKTANFENILFRKFKFFSLTHVAESRVRDGKMRGWAERSSQANVKPARHWCHVFPVPRRLNLSGRMSQNFERQEGRGWPLLHYQFRIPGWNRHCDNIDEKGKMRKRKPAHPYPRKWPPSDTYAFSSVENFWVVWSTKRNRTSSRLRRPCPSWWWHHQDFPRIPRNRLSVSPICPTNARSRRSRTPCNPTRSHRSRRIVSATKVPSSLLPVDEISLRYSRPDVDRSNRRTVRPIRRYAWHMHHKRIHHHRFPRTSIIDTVANWKSLNNNLMRQDDASLGHVTTYSKPRSRGYRAGKNGDVKIPPPVLFKPFAAWPFNSVPFKCNLFPTWTRNDQITLINRFSFFFFLIVTYSLPYTRGWTRAYATGCRITWSTKFSCWIYKWWVRTIHKMVCRTHPRTVVPRSIRNRIYRKWKDGKKRVCKAKLYRGYLHGLSIVIVPSPQWWDNAMVWKVAIITQEGHVTNSRLHWAWELLLVYTSEPSPFLASFLTIETFFAYKIPFSPNSRYNRRPFWTPQISSFRTTFPSIIAAIDNHSNIPVIVFNANNAISMTLLSLIASFARFYSAHTHHRLLSFSPSPPSPSLLPTFFQFFLISHAPIPIFARVTLGRNLTESKPMMHLLSMKGKNVLPFEKLPSRFTIYVISLVPNAVTYLLITVSSIFMVSFPHSRSLLIFSLSLSLSF